jgi:hypothetical protein
MHRDVKRGEPLGLDALPVVGVEDDEVAEVEAQIAELSAGPPT